MKDDQIQWKIAKTIGTKKSLVQIESMVTEGHTTAVRCKVGVGLYLCVVKDDEPFAQVYRRVF